MLSREFQREGAWGPDSWTPPRQAQVTIGFPGKSGKDPPREAIGSLPRKAIGPLRRGWTGGAGVRGWRVRNRGWRGREAGVEGAGSGNRGGGEPGKVGREIDF